MYETGRRNDQRNESYWNVDLKFTKEMNVGRGLNLQLSAEVFNLLNDGTYTDLQPVDSRPASRSTAERRARARFGRRGSSGMKMAF